MSIELLTILLFISVIILFAMGVPVGFALGSIALFFGVLLWGPRIFQMIPLTVVRSTSSFLLLAIPLFFFMGQMIRASGLGEAMIRSMHVLAGSVRGGLAIGIILVCSIISAMVGIIGVGIMTAGALAVLPMFKAGYNRHLALGSIMAGGGMGILIPPSIPMILFASVTNVSIGKMFAGGIIPGLIMIGFFIAYISIRCIINPNMGPPLPIEERGKFKDKLLALREAGLAFLLVLSVLGTILFGLATPTEAAAIGAVGSVMISLVYGRLSLSVIKEASSETMKLTGFCIWILIGASLFSNFHMLMGAGRMLTGFISDLNLSPWGVIILMQISMIVLGCFMDDFPIVLICGPLYTPIAVSLGFDPIWFGILIILNLEIGIQTPPYGFALFYLKGVTPKEVTMTDLYKSIGPFLVIKAIVLALCMAFPQIITWLPDLLFR